MYLFRYEKLQEKSSKLGEMLSEVHHSLSAFSGEAGELERWLSEATETVNESATAAKVEEIIIQRDSRKERLETVVRDGKTLVGKKDVTDTGPVRDRVKVSFNVILFKSEFICSYLYYA